MAGVIADLPSPFGMNDEIDIVAFGNLCERQIRAGATALLVGETAGEMATLTSDEHEALVRTAVEISGGRAKIIAGAGSNSTCQAITLSLRAEAAGADAVMSVVPYYNKPTQSGIKAHFLTIANATKLPIVLHDNPACCVRVLADETLLELSNDIRFIGLRDGSADTTRPLHLRERLPADFKLLSGHDAGVVAYLLHGGDGSISFTANAVPDLEFEIFEAWKQNEFVYAMTLMDRLKPLSAALSPEIGPAPLKYALSLLRLCSSRVRLPMVVPCGQQKAAITEAMAAALGP